MQKDNWILTSTGRQFWPLDPRPEDVSIEDIASALSNLCRFTGHVREFYSVAQHSVHASEWVPQQHALAALLHDASEAYLCDIARPVKQHAAMEAYRYAELRLERVICDVFSVDIHAPEVRAVDDLLLGTERRDLMPPSDLWPVGDCLAAHITPWGPIVARAAFMRRFKELTA